MPILPLSYPGAFHPCVETDRHLCGVGGIRTFAAMLMGVIRKASHELDTDYVRVW